MVSQKELMLCYKCDSFIEKEHVRLFSVSQRGYGSLFDTCLFTVQLCNNCHKPAFNDWFYEEPVIMGGMEVYQFEENISDLVNGFKIENREYVWNGMSGYCMERQDWIDMERGILSDEKYEQYGMYSPRQIRAYNEHFSACDFPINVSFSDGSKSCMCVHGATGEYDQIPSVSISLQCVLCPHFQFRKTPLEELSHEDFLEYQQFIIGKERYEKYQHKFEK